MKKTQETDFSKEITRSYHMRRSAGLISAIGMLILLVLLITGIS